MLHSIDSATSAWAWCPSLPPWGQVRSCIIRSAAYLLAVLKNGGFKVGENWIYYQDLPSWYFSQMWGYMTHQNHFGYFQASLNFTSVGSENLLIIKHQREFWSQKNHGRIKVCCSSWNSDLGWLIPNSDVLQSLGRHTYSAWVGGCDWFAVILLKKHRTVWNSHNTYIWEMIYIYIEREREIL